ncbi:MAG: UDP-N-acetylmuramate dehydrogenase [Clostridia bacterium]|nr:UDP-N-acetylmuramate dehydrogenase [Clostridia bacterium]
MTFLEETLGFIDPPVKQNESIKKHTTIGVGGLAKYFATPKSLYALRLLIESAKAHKLKHFILGKGSNVLFNDGGYNGLVISTERLQEVSVYNGKVKAMCGATLNKVIDFAKSRSLSGLEKLYGIPASIGGAITMNAGAFGATISDVVSCVETIKNGKLCKYYKSDCRFGYRKSRFINSKEVIVSATFDFINQAKELIEAQIKCQKDLRKTMHPMGKSFGSVFKNPNCQKLTAGQIIDRAGLKGYRIGGAMVSSEHANFIVNVKNATAKDILNLIYEIKERVYKTFNIELKEEVIIVGGFHDFNC